jgi:hypothetical protein
MAKERSTLYLQALAALRQREGLFRVLIFSLVTVFFWIGFSIFLSQTKTKVSIDIQKHTEPLNPNINRTTLEELATRRVYTPEELQNFPLYERVTDENGVSQVILAGTKVVPVTIETLVEEETVTASASAVTATPSATPTITTSPIATGSAQP